MATPIHRLDVTKYTLRNTFDVGSNFWKLNGIQNRSRPAIRKSCSTTYQKQIKPSSIVLLQMFPRVHFSRRQPLCLNTKSIHTGTIRNTLQTCWSMKQLKHYSVCFQKSNGWNRKGYHQQANTLPILDKGTSKRPKENEKKSIKQMSVVPPAIVPENFQKPSKDDHLKPTQLLHKNETNKPNKDNNNPKMIVTNELKPWMAGTANGSINGDETNKNGLEVNYNIVETTLESSDTVESVKKHPQSNVSTNQPTIGTLPGNHNTKVSNVKRSHSFVLPQQPESKWQRFKIKVLQFRDFFLSYRDGISLFAQEMRIAIQLARRVYWERHRYSRREKLQLQQSAADLAKLLPITSMLMVFGLEVSTITILRLFPGLMPNALRSKVEPQAQKLGIAPEDREEEQLNKKLAIASQIRQVTKEVTAKRTNVVDDPTKQPEVAKFIASLENHERMFTLEEIIAISPAFRMHMTMDKLPREQLLNLAALHTPNIAYRLAPRAFLARRLRHHVQKIRADDKEIHWEGIGNLSDEEVLEACEKRGLIGGKTKVIQQNKLVLRKRLETWMKLSLNREIPSSLLLVSCALMIRDQYTENDEQCELQSATQVQLQILMEKEKVISDQLNVLESKLLEIHNDINRYKTVLELEKQSNHNDTTHGIASSNLSDQDRDVLLGLRCHEADTVRTAFRNAQASTNVIHDDDPVPIGDIVIDELSMLINNVLKEKRIPGVDRTVVAQLLKTLDHDQDGFVDYVDFVNVYEELLRRQEEKGEVDRRREALIRLKQILDDGALLNENLKNTNEINERFEQVTEEITAHENRENATVKK